MSSNYWKLLSGTIQPNISTWTLTLPYLPSKNCIGTDSNGLLQTGTCGSGTGTVTQINTTWPILGGPITTTGTLTFGGLSTSTAAVVGNIPYFSGVKTFANVATTSLSNGTGISFTGTAGALVGGTNLTITNSSPLSGLTTSFPLSFSNPALSWIGLATSTNISNGQVLYATGVNTLSGYATSSASAASRDVWRDANQNAFAQNFVSAGTSFPTLGTTATLTNASPRNWVLTGTNTQTMKLPSGTTLSIGAQYLFNDNSTKSVSVIDNGSNAIGTILAGGSRLYTIYDTSTTNGSWDGHGFLGHAVYSGYNSLSLGSSTPFAELSVHANANDTTPYTTLFAIGSSTAVATTTLFSISNTGSTTAANGFNITAGCYAIAGTCLSTGGAVSSVSNSDGTLTISPTTGAVVANLNPAHSNWWTALQNFTNASTSQLEATSSVWLASASGTVGVGVAPSTGNGLYIKNVATVGLESQYTSVDNVHAIEGVVTGGVGTQYGIYGLVTAGATTNYALYGNAQNATTNWGLYVAAGDSYLGAGKVGIASSTPTYPFSVGAASAAFGINSNGGIVLHEDRAATSTAYSLNWSTTGPQVLYQTGASATTIYLIAATTSAYVGSRKLVVVCNPGASAGAITWVGAEWAGGTTPTQTTTANQCDAWSFFVTAATSTSASPVYKVFGAASTGFQ